MRAFAFICFAAAAPKCWALLDQGSNHPRRLSTNTWEQLKITASDAARYDDFGGSVAIDGNTIVVGAYSDDDGSGCTNEWCDSGSVYVLRTSDGGATYDEVAKLTISDAAVDDMFGYSVAIDGDTIVVGAYRKGDYTGAVYVFRTTDGGATYSQVAKLTASDAEEDDGFGYSVAIDGNTVVVGANKYDNSGSGAAYVFRTSDGGASYDQVAKLTGDVYFGQSVAIAGGTVVIGAPFESGAGTYSGAAFVFRTTDSGATYNQVANVTAADAASGDYFGWSVAIDGNTVVVGTFEGEAAYVFRTTDGSAAYGQVAKLTASDAASNDEFGISVAISGDTVVVGARANTNYGGSGWGSAYVFRTTDGGATYDEVTKLTASGAASGDNDFGCSVAIDGDTVAIGARYDDNLGSYSDSGSVYVSWPPAPTVQPTPRPTFQPTTPQPTMSPKPTPQPTLPQPTPQPTTPQPSTASLGSDSATRACGKLATALLAFTATALAL